MIRPTHKADHLRRRNLPGFFTRFLSNLRGEGGDKGIFLMRCFAVVFCFILNTGKGEMLLWFRASESYFQRDRHFQDSKY